MDLCEFHEEQRRRYAAKQERQYTRYRWLRLWIVFNLALLAFLAAFVLTYLYCTGAWTP
jgi:ABC-type multidrug transport system permease subunit